MLERVACDYVGLYLEQTGLKNLVLSGGVVANVKMNQRLYELPGGREDFRLPEHGRRRMRHRGCAAPHSWATRRERPLHDVYLGPSYSDDQIAEALQKRSCPSHGTARSSRRSRHCSPRARWSPASMGAWSTDRGRSATVRSCTTRREPEVNQWLNQRLGRTEFMPFAPATLWSTASVLPERERARTCGGVHDPHLRLHVVMKDTCPAAVHVDGTARPQCDRRRTRASTILRSTTRSRAYRRSSTPASTCTKSRSSVHPKTRFGPFSRATWITWRSGPAWWPTLRRAGNHAHDRARRLRWHRWTCGEHCA